MVVDRILRAFESRIVRYLTPGGVVVLFVLAELSHAGTDLSVDRTLIKPCRSLVGMLIVEPGCGCSQGAAPRQSSLAHHRGRLRYGERSRRELRWAKGITTGR